ncbi:HEAT repeat domain-containing protein [Candidatus Uabimicrobium sp. HlEnr_7]|uniref:HEAT repeat domain-containing protein n=1 Tax=Candidatus Uabimicrobium helgolandensis TaxID=3095367 RepID=UPI003556A38F
MHKVRIGYPYANSDPQTIREAVVVLSANKYRGFKHVHSDNNVYKLVESDEGPAILNRSSKGVKGELLETDDNRKSIVRRGYVIGQGKSMQLALVLAAFSKAPVDSSQPLILFSAAIECPEGAPSFIDSKIATYAREHTIANSLQSKYQAATFAKSTALVLPIRDAKILGNCLNKQWKQLCHLSEVIQRGGEEPQIIGVEEHDLPTLAKMLGISPYHYKQPSHTKKLYIPVILSLLLFLVIFYWPKKPRSKPSKTSKQISDVSKITEKKTSQKTSSHEPKATNQEPQAANQKPETKNPTDRIPSKVFSQQDIDQVIKELYEFSKKVLYRDMATFHKEFYDLKQKVDDAIENTPREILRNTISKNLKLRHTAMRYSMHFLVGRMKTPPKKFAPQLLQFLERNSFSSLAIVSIIVNSNIDTENLILYIKSKRSSIRIGAIRALTSKKNRQQILPYVIAACSDSSRIVEREAVTSLWKFSVHKDITATLVNKLRNKRLSDQAAYSLICVGQKEEYIPTIIKELQTTTNYHFLKILELTTPKTPEMLPVFLDKLHKSPQRLQKYINQISGKKPLLIDMLNHEQEHIRYAVLICIQNTALNTDEKSQVITKLQKIVSDDSQRNVTLGASLLINLQSSVGFLVDILQERYEVAVPIILDLQVKHRDLALPLAKLLSSELQRKEEVIQLLGDINNEACIPYIVTQIQKSQAACKTLLKLNAIDEVLSYMKKTPQVYILEALAQQKRYTLKTVQLLREMLDQEDDKMKLAAATAYVNFTKNADDLQLIIDVYQRSMNSEIKIYALQCLGKIDLPLAVQYLEKEARNQNEYQLTAIKSLKVESKTALWKILFSTKSIKIKSAVCEILLKSSLSKEEFKKMFFFVYRDLNRSTSRSLLNKIFIQVVQKDSRILLHPLYKGYFLYKANDDVYAKIIPYMTTALHTPLILDIFKRKLRDMALVTIAKKTILKIGQSTIPHLKKNIRSRFGDTQWKCSVIDAILILSKKDKSWLRAIVDDGILAWELRAYARLQLQRKEE